MPATAVVLHPNTDTEIETQRRVARLALLTHATVDIPHAKLHGYRVVGFIIQTDEHYTRGEGTKLLDALQTMAGVDLKLVNSGIRDRMNAPLDLADYLAETAE